MIFQIHKIIKFIRVNQSQQIFKMTQISRVGMTLSLIMIMAACSRSKESSSVSVVIPIDEYTQSLGSQKVSTLSTSTGDFLAHIVVSVSASDMAKPILWNWDSKDERGNLNTPPASVTLEIPTGSGRIIQYLAVFQNATTGVMQFNYGDHRSDLYSGEQTVTIQTSNVGSSSKEGQLKGRYLDSSGRGPTGLVVGEFTPPASASSMVSPPPMAVLLESIYSGWFGFMVFEGVKFRYKMLVSNQVLFEGVSLDQTDFTSAASLGTKKLRISVPKHYRTFNQSVQDAELSPAEDVVFGFFGPWYNSHSGYNVCYDSSVSTGTMSGINNSMFDGNNAGSGTPDDITINNNPIGYVASTTTDYCDAQTACLKGGGFAAGSNTQFSNAGCGISGATEWDNLLKFNPQDFDEGNDGRLGFSGPFKYVGGTHDYVYVTYDSSADTTVANIAWDFLTGVQTDSNSISGVSVFYTENTNLDMPHGDDSSLCPEVVKNAGFIWARDVLKNSTSTSLSGLANASNAKVVLCPYINTLAGKVYFTRGFESHNVTDTSSI